MIFSGTCQLELREVAAPMEVRTLTMRVRYCGGCNPEIDRGSLVSRFKGILQADGIQAVFCKDGEADWLLLVNGCPRACLEEELPRGAIPRRCISVEGSHLDHRPVIEDELPQAVWEALRKGQGSSKELEIISGKRSPSI